MASNSKTRARKVKATKRKAHWVVKFKRDVKKIFDTGDLPTHYVGHGQAFTKGKTTK